jgi:hypothetical protein
MQEESYLEVEANIGINCSSKKCMEIHPSELYMIYASGSLVVIKSVDGEKDKFLKGHGARVNFITCSSQGNLLCTGEAHDLRSSESAALIVWDFNSL